MYRLIWPSVEFTSKQRLAAMLAVKRLAGVAPEVNLRGHTSCTPPPGANKAVQSSFETQRRCHQKSKIFLKEWKKFYIRVSWNNFKPIRPSLKALSIKYKKTIVMINIQNSIITSSPQGKRSDNHLQRKIHLHLWRKQHHLCSFAHVHLLVINGFLCCFTSE